MRLRQLIRVAPLLIAIPLASDGCKLEPTVGGVQTVTTPQAHTTPITVEGCLKSGVMADNTWVVLGRTTEPAPSEAASTYQLVNADPNQLRDHANKTVRVSGTLESEQQVINSTGRVEEKDRARGTSGTPEVSATAVVDVRHLRVSSVTPLGADCG